MNKFKLDIIKEGIYFKNHMIKFDPESTSLLLYDLKGVLLDEKFFDYLIDNICIIDDNYFLIRKFKNMIIKIKIINNHIEIIDKLFIHRRLIYDFIYNKESKLLIISFRNFIGIWDIDSLLKNPIQIINYPMLCVCCRLMSNLRIPNELNNLYNFNSNLFISYNNRNILVYQKTNDRKLYQLLSFLNFNNNNISYKLNLIKVDNTTLMVTQNKEIYFIDIRSMITKKRFKFKNRKGEIEFLYNKNKDIYIYTGKYIYAIRYNKYNLKIIDSRKKSKLKNEIYSDPKSAPIIVELRNENIYNFNESVKFLSLNNHQANIYFEKKHFGPFNILRNLK